MNQNIVGLNESKTKNLLMTVEAEQIEYRYQCNAKAVFGLGERYCSVNHKGRRLVNSVIEQFTRQNEITYFPLPFFHASDGHGVYVETACEVVFEFAENETIISLRAGVKHLLHFFYGTPEQIVRQFINIIGHAVMPPKWAFGVWASANRWNCQAHIEEQLRLFKKYEYPVSVIVIEAWSDEATFYIWNGAKYEPSKSDRGLKLADFTFQEPWHDPLQMIRDIHEDGIKIVLWQIPALKQLGDGEVCVQHDIDCEYAQQHQLVATNPDRTPYRIPKQWFIGSMLPDFAKPETCRWWMDKRRYLLDEMGVDGFKTDGGEFVHDEETCFAYGKTGTEIKNLYPVQYEMAYESMLSENQVLFSRAGYTGSQKAPMHWAGDQMSSYSELRAVLNAGLSLSLCGVPFWNFDIGGFAGPLPDAELYLRATALAAFVPAMQWHSEPADGQFQDIMQGDGGTNDRSPWNMAYVTEDGSVLDKARYFANLHMNFLPHIYSEAIKAAKKGSPLMRHLFFNYSTDERAMFCDDEYMIGDLLVAPVIEQGVMEREIYLPQGRWFDFWSGEEHEGGSSIKMSVPLDVIPLFIRDGGAVALNLNAAMKPGDTIGNRTDGKIVIVYAGDPVDYCYYAEADVQENMRDILKSDNSRALSIAEFVQLAD